MSTLQEAQCTSKCSADPTCATRCSSCSPIETCSGETKDVLQCSGTTNCQTGDDQVCTDPNRKMVNAINCSGTTNCQTGDDQTCTDPNRTIEGQCAGQFTKTVTDAELVLMDLAITNYGFDQVRYRLVSEGLLPADEIEVAIGEFRKFLMIIAHTDGPVAMISPKVDEVWHAFILHTPDYMAFTQDVFGTYLHHQPNTPATPSVAGGVDNFLKVYNELFGELDPIWRSHYVTA